MTKVLALIPARGGSKGVPKKNIRILCGKPLIAYSIEHAQEVGVDRVIVFTDDQLIANLSKEYGAEVPFMEPKELARDNSPLLPVYQYALEWLEKNEEYTPDVVLSLQPTCPIRQVKVTKDVLEALDETGCDSVRTGFDARKYHPYWMLNMSKDGSAYPYIPNDPFWKYPTRQTLPPIYRHNGVTDAIRTDALMLGDLDSGMWGRDIHLVLMEEGTWINIDSEFDFMLAEVMLRKRY
jgi:CMP-N-acetylneuraminic acid synthetase